MNYRRKVIYLTMRNKVTGECWSVCLGWAKKQMKIHNHLNLAFLVDLMTRLYSSH